MTALGASWFAVYILILDVFWPLLGNAEVWGQFSATHHYRLGRPYLPNFIEISKAVSPLVKENCGQTRIIYVDL